MAGSEGDDEQLAGLQVQVVEGEAGAFGGAQAGVEEGEEEGFVTFGGGAVHGEGFAGGGGGGFGGGACGEEGFYLGFGEGVDFFGGVAGAREIVVGAREVELEGGPGVEGADGFPGVFDGGSGEGAFVAGGAGGGVFGAEEFEEGAQVRGGDGVEGGSGAEVDEEVDGPGVDGEGVWRVAVCGAGDGVAGECLGKFHGKRSPIDEFGNWRPLTDGGGQGMRFGVGAPGVEPGTSCTP